MKQRILASVLVAGLVGSTLAATAPAAAAEDLSIEVPPTATVRQTTAVTLTLPGNVAAVDGRVLVDGQALELVGVAPNGQGETLAPVAVDGGYAFAAFGLRPRSGRTQLRLVFAPLNAGQPEIRVLIDAAADAAGRRLNLARTQVLSRMAVGKGSRSFRAPAGAPRPRPARAAGDTRGVFGRDVITLDDLDLVRGAWYSTRHGDTSCGAAEVAGADANDDGCVDIVDLQALLAAQGRRVQGAVEPAPATGASPDMRFTASLTGPPPAEAETLDAPMTFIVTSTADTPDASPGNGACADSQGRCTLRAALTESNWNSGVDRIHFNLPGTVPVRIQLGGTLPNVGATSGGVIIDGYTQPGSRPNTATFGTNAIPGVEVRGTGTSMSHVFYAPQGGSTFRGLLINSSYRGIFMDTPNSRGNRVIGTFIGFNADNSLPARGRAGVWINNGARENLIGTPALADRNVIGNYDKAIFSYGSGTFGNISQNNMLCLRPNGMGALCQIGLDHDFGPKGSLTGGTGPNERNVIGPTTINGMEFSHGWNPSTRENTVAWQVNDHRAIGNWIGFRQDGNYDPAYRVAQNVPTYDNGQGVNIYDGANNNLIEGNHIAAVYDGLTIGMSNSTGNVVRNNIFGQSPHGQAAPLNRRGIYLYSNTRSHTVEGNVIRNVGAVGIALLDFNVRQIRLSRNLVINTNGPAIHLEPDPNNPSTGANGLIPPPDFAVAGTTQANGNGTAGATVEVFLASRALGQLGLPIEFLGSGVAASNGSWSVAYSRPLKAGERVTALQIRTNGDTSQLAPNVYAGGPSAAPVADFTFAQQAGTLRVDFTDTSTGIPGSWSWSFGDGTTSNEQNPSRTYDAGGDYSVRLTVTNSSGSSTRTQTVTVTPLPPGTVLASDTFSRNLTNEWGGADTGGEYAVEGTAASYSVSSGVGVMNMPSARTNRAVMLNEVLARDVDMMFRVRSDKPASGSSLYVYGVVRRNGNNAYRPKIILNSNGSVAVHSGVLINNAESSVAPSVTVPGLTHSANNFIWVRAQVTGASPTTIRVKAWADGAPEPSNWQFTASNSASAVQTAGSIGLRVFIDAVNNAPVVFNFDDYLAKTPGGADTPPPPPPPAPVANFTSAQQAGSLTVDFTDTSTGSPTSWSWDFGDGGSSTQRNPSRTYAAAGDYSVSLTATNASGAHTVTKTVTVAAVPPSTTLAADTFGRTVSNGWGSATTGGAYTLEGSSANFSVGGGVGSMVLPATGATRATLLPAVSARDVDITFRVRSDKAAVGGAQYVYGVVRRNSNNAYRPKIILNTNGTVAVHAGQVVNNSESSVAPAVIVPGLTHTANSFIWVRAQVTGASPTTIRVKAWADGQAEPSAWHFSATNSNSALQTAGAVGLRAYISSTNVPITLAFDDFSVRSLP